MGYEEERLGDAKGCGCYTVTREHDFWSSTSEYRVLCRQHQEMATRQYVERERKRQDHLDLVVSVSTTNYVPIREAVEKYRSSDRPNNSDRWIKNWLLRTCKCLDFKLEKGKYYCSKEKLDVIDFDALFSC